MRYKANEKSFPSGTSVLPVLNHITKLHQLVGPMSWFIFHLLNQAVAWLNNNPSAWEEDLRFKEMKTFIKTLKVANDTAEHGVKLKEDFGQSITKNEEQLKIYFSPLKKVGKKFPFRKSLLNEM
ncbi:hypothetical protein AVEN_151703-1 [Araneus ventricosus]|uniref:Uncharacterized protein n=1 Tax=Araneus ventricosus TaxID=182803 RepID=A0A4Y2DPM2_ARAVE|nr:hypothetical protein AVEN_151703-1 [Araneus ventricosus]